MNLYPLLFKPIFKERIWGGRHLEQLFQKPLPASLKIGESWEISDRPEAESEVANGPLAGKSLTWLLQNHPRELLGEAKPLNGRFPLLVKILDARDRLSLQVHPPAHKAAQLGGEPKTEMWYITHSDPKAELYVGLRRGTAREEFTRKLGDGTVAECFHRIEVRAGDAMFLPSGRVHAIGSGLVIFEIQQNSDTTYRAFDWNRVDETGKSRQLHINECLESIDFEDFEPELIRPDPQQPLQSSVHIQPLVEDPLFSVEVVTHAPPSRLDYSLDVPRVIGVIEGQILIKHPEHPVQLKAGQFCLLPAGMEQASIEAAESAKILAAKPGS